LAAGVARATGDRDCNPGETHRETPSLCKIPTLYRENLAEDRHQHFRGGLSKKTDLKNNKRNYAKKTKIFV
jgi:hypothetical protein